ncbi:hypothetical protein FA048_02410 [Pedobacter polaris]|uniref:Uncharacterized protein n=1 Tax=Pedobacter polaris TaxID=2571273 RepID=A0A4U1CTH1_9SPHI|nr:hypothetical protein [Pedobacter polaris]TKC12491.1 hypothetical protein FA048_02410 [Pedobacter polaris]
MSNKTKYIVRGGLWVWLFLMAISLQAQEGHRAFQFKQGEEYQTEMLTNSSAVLKRGNQLLNINSVTTATKTYKVTSTNDKEYSFNVEIKKMDLVLDALGQKLIYNSETGFDSTSTILKALNFMIKKPINLVINKYGIIQSSTDYKAELATDTLVSFAGLQPEVFEKQTLFSMLADITYDKSLIKGFSWADSVVIDKQKLKTNFTIEEITENNTIVKFTNSIVGKLISSNTNGTYVIDNKTGLITEKLLYSISVGYQISAGNTVYAVSRSTSVTERTKKIK